MNRLSLALSCAALVSASTVLATPGTATAAKGGGGGTTTCTPVVSVNNGAVDKPASRKVVVPQVQVTNCGGADVTIAFRIVATRYTLRSTDPYLSETCSSAPYGGQSGTLRSGRSEVYSASATVPSCPSPYGTSPWGVDGTYSVDYAFDVLDATTGTLLGSAVTTIQHAGGA